MWEVMLLACNALAYNEEDSLIVKHGKIVVQTVIKFIRLPTKLMLVMTFFTACFLQDSIV